MFVKHHGDFSSLVPSAAKEKIMPYTAQATHVAFKMGVKMVSTWCSGSRWGSGSSISFHMQPYFFALCLLHMGVRAIQLECLSAITIAPSVL